MCALLLVAGNVTTTDLIGNGVLTLLCHPQELSKLRADPSLMGSAVEEMLRYERPVGTAVRHVLRDATIGGCPIAGRSHVTASLTSSNRDERVFADAETFDISRAENPHISFGGGIRVCLGAPLARAEAQVAIAALLERFPVRSLAVPRDELRWRKAPFFRGLEALPVTIGG